MRHRLLFTSFIIALIGAQCSLQSAFAQPPDLLRSYRFIPRLSTLHQTGGFAGIDRRLRIYGNYDFITGFRGDVFPVPTLEPYAQFANVEAKAGHPTSTDPKIDIDEVLNLSGLDGEPIYHGPHGLSVFAFSGDDGHEAEVWVFVATLGRWMFMRGGTSAPCCDFFEYDIKAISRQDPYGDFDGDGDVRAADLTAWWSGQDEAGNTLGGRDFLAWQRSYGETAPSIIAFESMLDAALLTAGITSEVNAIPEPTTCALALGAICLAICRRRLAGVYG